MTASLTLVVHDAESLLGKGPGGTPRSMQKVTLNDTVIGYLAFQNYAREGGVYEAFLPDASTLLARDQSAEVLALELAVRKHRLGR